MLIPSREAHPSENIGLIDRLLRFAIGLSMLIGGMVVYYNNPHMPVLAAWMLILIAASVYPLLTTVIGVDPFYRLFKVRSCNDSGRNQCGTFPYQVKAAMGKAPAYCETDDMHSLDACHDEPEERPHHPNWKTDRPPHAKRMIDEENKSAG